MQSPRRQRTDIHTQRLLSMFIELPTDAWVLSCRRVGDTIAGWVVKEITRQESRCLEVSERCDITSFCYPTGAKLVRAKLVREECLERCA